MHIKYVTIGYGTLLEHDLQQYSRGAIPSQLFRASLYQNMYFQLLGVYKYETLLDNFFIAYGRQSLEPHTV